MTHSMEFLAEWAAARLPKQSADDAVLEIAAALKTRDLPGLGRALASLLGVIHREAIDPSPLVAAALATPVEVAPPNADAVIPFAVQHGRFQQPEQNTDARPADDVAPEEPVAALARGKRKIPG